MSAHEAGGRSPAPLVDLQRFLADAIRARKSGEGSPARRGRWEVADLVATGQRLSPAEQVEIYREQFWRRHLASLRDDYPTVLALLGDARFESLVADYLEAHPPRTFDLRQLGADLPVFVASLASLAEEPILADAARYDRAFMEAFDAPEGGTFDPSSLATAAEDAWPSARITFQPSVIPIATRFPLHAYRVAVRRGELPGERPAPRIEHNVVYRSDTLIYARPIEPMAFDLIGALRHDAPLGEACEAVARAHGVGDAEGLAPRLGAWFQEWTSLGWVRAVSFP
jgi:hypothetical protein